MLVSEYNYDLPEERIAKFPPKERGSTRLLVLNRETGAIEDSYYRDLDQFLNPGDVLILNDTRVMQSRLFCTLPDGRKRELVVLEKHGDEPQRVMYRGKLHEKDILNINEHKIVVAKLLGNGIAEVESDVPLAELAEKYGTVPLPPYLHREATEDDKMRYQTVWAKNMGSAAAPTASLNMTEDLLSRLKQKGVIIKYLTLHVGLGTFLPIRSDKVEDHEMHSEWFRIPEDTVAAISHPHGRVVALGTTVARTLEYYARTGKTSGEDNIFIYPGFKFKIVDALITNYHAPKSTVLMLAAAFAGWDNLKKAYEHAIDEKYNFLSYGDSMLIC
ncbi:tRNA preQ1(34) S-adenosylmethionine ribosyltransferase-isomerase QueA [Candidatus Saccharibacteria bacterium]|nr:tRNA preQ1(34) S-adenosylmethionine ribosyltransferase-isomerase QueA [Candidatus Saccharibacteria bacterium]